VQHPKAVLRTLSGTGRPLRIKVEMNTFERAPAPSTTLRPLAVAISWFTGSADIPTFALEVLASLELNRGKRPTDYSHCCASRSSRSTTRRSRSRGTRT
jgi:hypothetical protein